MRTIAVIPVKTLSRRVVGKNFRPFAGRPLFEHFFDRVPAGCFDAVFVDTDSDHVAAGARTFGFDVIEREPRLAGDDANGNDLLLHHAGLVDADVYVQLFITAPLLRPETMAKAVDVLAAEPGYDSVFTAQQIHSWFWFDEAPVNYDPAALPRSQDAKPVVRETTGLYAIRREALLDRRCRIGRAPYMLLVDTLEAMDVDTEEDLAIAQACLPLLGGSA